jgi:transposase
LGTAAAPVGHDVRLISPQYVKAYLKRVKNDAADAAAICEAATRRSMRFVPIKSEEQQGVPIMHCSRDLLVRPNSAKCRALIRML